jgi:hypothetical protein
MCVLIFSTVLSETFLIPKRTERYVIKNLEFFARSARARHCYPIILKVNFLDSFPKNSNMKFHENPSSGSRVVTYGQTDGRT